MTELEKIAYAKRFIDQMAMGINPLDGMPIPEGEVAKQVRISRCFAYVSEILGQVLDNGGIGRIDKTVPFSVTPEEAARFPYSDEPISGSEIAKRLADIIENPMMKSFSVQTLNQWLMQEGLLAEVENGEGKKQKIPTQNGRMMGICTEHRTGQRGEYTAILFNRAAQKFIMERIQRIVLMHGKK